MKITTQHLGASTLAADLAALSHELDGPAHLVIAYVNVTAGRPVVDALNAWADGASVLAATSCSGAMTQDGLTGFGDAGAAVFAISDSEGSYGTGFSEIGEDAVDAGSRAIHAALADADRIGEMPELIWINTSPGTEESVIAGIESVTADMVPVIGGSCADDAIVGDWFVSVADESATQGVAVAAFFPSVEVSHSFQSGYMPTGTTGVITRSTGRCILEIDGQPAAKVYNEWTNGAIDEAMHGGDPNVLGASTMFPLGRHIGSVGDGGSALPYFGLLHPERVTEDGGLAVFADVSVGDELHLMSGSKDSLITRAGRVATEVAQDPDGSQREVFGSLVTYCAGCMLAVEDRLPEVVAGLNSALDNRPFLGGFTFGEQGALPAGENIHGNLMISVIAFHE